MTPFIEQLNNLTPLIQRQLDNCPQVMPNRQQLIALRPGLNAARSWILSRGQDGNLNVLNECTIFGLLDKNNLPNGVTGWGNWMLNLETQVNVAIASQNSESANVVNRNLVNERFLNNSNGNSNSSFVNRATDVISNTANEVVSWWNSPMFSIYDYRVTPLNMAILYGVYHVTSRRRK